MNIEVRRLGSGMSMPNAQFLRKLMVLVLFLEIWVVGLPASAAIPANVVAWGRE
jgi:hypothetical protein